MQKLVLKIYEYGSESFFYKIDAYDTESLCKKLFKKCSLMALIVLQIMLKSRHMALIVLQTNSFKNPMLALEKMFFFFCL